jgi:hypothetical protein
VPRTAGCTRRAYAAGGFLTEALLLSTLGGLSGTAVGRAITVGYAQIEHTGFGVPTEALRHG